MAADGQAESRMERGQGTPGAAIEMPGNDALPVTPRVLEGPAREDARRRITTVQPCYGK